MFFVWLIVAALIVVVDQLVKHWVVVHLALGASHELIPNLMGLLYVRNYGAAWSILQGKTWFFYAVTSVAIVVVLYLMFKKRHGAILFNLGLSFILGGAVGNFIDRLHLKYVVDMFQLKFINFPIFNVADTFVSIGVIILFIYLIFFDKENDE
ncbi:lipoprotein signal peptidase [Agrilactobacillus composti DSM 18527 = JCM 14202]|uniref:signal peptidase II n=1 Tax=Agrilactobacillus composti TaxID=398555 RepID=UPI00042E005D|nr:signal peptidase II [Agrilactobacillus composti]GAF41357.1 lipoprotein signal peptidase [Agrilactobacillus composti DSM 18527 = JCM 14202]